jgi:Uncharacterised nucleotidyltransferase
MTEHDQERKLLNACLRPGVGETKPEQLNDLLRSGLDWPYLIATAQRHALCPLLFHRLQKCDSDLVPASRLRELKTHYQENLARDLVLMDELLSVARDLRANGVDCLPFKGPLLGRAAYDDPALRQSVDLDILILPANFAKARDCLRARGYKATNKVDLRQEQVLIRNQHNIQFARDNNSLLVELHWRIAPPLFASGMGAEQLWDRLKTVKVRDVEFKALPTEELLLTLCVHGARHLWERMSWVCDIAGVLFRNHNLDFQRLLQRARETDSERMLLLGLCLARDCAAASLPNEIERKISSDAVVSALAREITQRFFVPDTPLTYAQTMRDQLRLREHWRARARYLRFAMAPNEEDLGVKSLPPVLNFAYYAMRPWRLLFKRSGERAANQ